MCMLSILLTTLCLFLSSLAFIFLFWKRLKEDYTRNQIFKTAFAILLVFLFVGIASKLLINFHSASNIFNPSGLWLWLALISSFLVFLFCQNKFKMRFFETLEALTVSLFAFALGASLLLLPLATIFFAALLGLFFLINQKYRHFKWYKSGKLGLAGLVGLGTFFTVRAIVALINPNMVSFMGKVDALVSSVIAFIIYLGIYNLSERD